MRLRIPDFRPSKKLQLAEASFRDLIPRVPSALHSCKFLGRVTCNRESFGVDLVMCDKYTRTWNSVQIPWFIPGDIPKNAIPSRAHDTTLHSLLVTLRSPSGLSSRRIRPP